MPSQSVSEPVSASLLNAMTVQCNDMTVQNVHPCSKKHSQFKLMFSAQILPGSFSYEVGLYDIKCKKMSTGTDLPVTWSACRGVCVCESKTVINSSASVACHSFKIERKDHLFPEINRMQLPRAQCPIHNEEQGSRQ